MGRAALFALLGVIGCQDYASRGRDAAPAGSDGSCATCGGADAGERGGADAGSEGEPTYSFIVFGDNQHATPMPEGPCLHSGNIERLALPEVAVDLNPDFAIHTGDLMDRGDEVGAYDGLEMHCYPQLLSTVPFFPTLGNHDVGYTDSSASRYRAYLQRQLFETNPESWGPGYEDDVVFAPPDDTDYNLPENKAQIPMRRTVKSYYSFRHQNAVFISMEVGTVYWTNTPTGWLEDRLAEARANPGVDHVFVYQHNPVYSTAMAEYNTRPDGSLGEQYGLVRDAYEELFRAYDVTMVFSGHNHVYEHIYVPDDGEMTRTSGPERLTDLNRPSPPVHREYGQAPGTGVHYIVTGGGGGNRLGACNSKPELPERSAEAGYRYSQGRSTCNIYHLVQVNVVGDQLHVEVIGYGGDGDAQTTELWESFAVKGGVSP